MAFCPECGAKVDEDSSFCSSCGADLDRGSTESSDPDTVVTETEAVRLETQEYPRSVDDINGKSLAIAIGLAIPLGLVLWMTWALMSQTAGVAVWLLGTLAFVALLYRYPDWKWQLSAGIFYLAILAFVFPVAFFIGSIVLASGKEGVDAGVTVLAGFIGFFISWFFAWLIGAVLYLLSNRLSPANE